MSISPRRMDFWLLTFLPAIIAIAVVLTLMAVFLMPMAQENKVRLEERFRQNRIEAVQEYEADGREEGRAGSIKTASAPAETPVR